MPTEDPYELLGVPRDAGVHEIRMAYRRLALKVHPDSQPDNPVQAAKRFHELTMAYKAASHAAERGTVHRGSFRNGQGRIYTPGDLAREFAAAGGRGQREVDPADLSEVPLHWKVRVPTLNEPRAFVAFWTLAVLAGLGASAFVAAYLKPGTEMTAGASAWVLGVSIAAYAAVLVAGVVGILLTRQVVLLAYQLTAWARRALPGTVARKALPRFLFFLRSEQPSRTQKR
ncbi:MAG: DnaJ domain-containing protein [Phycisphaerae bacterium]